MLVLHLQINIAAEFKEEIELLDGNPDRKKIMPASKIHSIFQRISNQQCSDLGLDPGRVLFFCLLGQQLVA